MCHMFSSEWVFNAKKHAAFDVNYAPMNRLSVHLDHCLHVTRVLCTGSRTSMFNLKVFKCNLFYFHSSRKKEWTMNEAANLKIQKLCLSSTGRQFSFPQIWWSSNTPVSPGSPNHMERTSNLWLWLKIVAQRSREQGQDFFFFFFLGWEPARAWLMRRMYGSQ